jgi:hypothetical protein
MNEVMARSFAFQVPCRVTSGFVLLYTHLLEGQPTLVFPPGSILPRVSVLPGGWTYDAMTAETSREVGLKLPVAHVTPVELTEEVERGIAAMLHAVSLRTYEVGLSNRVLEALELFGPLGSHDVLATLIGSVRESVTKALGGLKGRIIMAYGFVGLPRHAELYPGKRPLKGLGR